MSCRLLICTSFLYQEHNCVFSSPHSEVTLKTDRHGVGRKFSQAQQRCREGGAGNESVTATKMDHNPLSISSILLGCVRTKMRMDSKYGWPLTCMLVVSRSKKEISRTTLFPCCFPWCSTKGYFNHHAEEVFVIVNLGSCLLEQLARAVSS